MNILNPERTYEGVSPGRPKPSRVQKNIITAYLFRLVRTKSRGPAGFRL